MTSKRNNKTTPVILLAELTVDDLQGEDTFDPSITDHPVKVYSEETEVLLTDEGDHDEDLISDSFNGEAGAGSTTQTVTMSDVESFEGISQTAGGGELYADGEGADAQDYSQVITHFLNHNPKPSDAQVHALAEALGVDKEALEAQMYAMLAEFQNEDEEETTMASLRVWAYTKTTALTEDERVLEDDYDPQTAPPDAIVLNDGEQFEDTQSEEIKDALLDDGAPVDLEEDQEVLINDGRLLPPEV